MRHRSPARNLRIAVDCLPVETRRAMLDGIAANRIIVGAYTDRQGGVCPMLAAHRKGGRTSLVSFARAWDRYTGARGKPRPASEREVNTLRSMLEASVGLEEIPSLADVPRPRRRRPPRKTGERPCGRGRAGPPRTDAFRARELRYQPGWAWLRPFRRLDEYEEAVSALAVTRPNELDLRHETVGRGA
jgi:hypothetical protein